MTNSYHSFDGDSTVSVMHGIPLHGILLIWTVSLVYDEAMSIEAATGIEVVPLLLGSCSTSFGWQQGLTSDQLCFFSFARVTPSSLGSAAIPHTGNAHCCLLNIVVPRSDAESSPVHNLLPKIDGCTKSFGTGCKPDSTSSRRHTSLAVVIAGIPQNQPRARPYNIATPALTPSTIWTSLPFSSPKSSIQAVWTTSASPTIPAQPRQMA